MLNLRRYRKSDAQQVGILIADTYKRFNLSELTTEQQNAMLGPFLHARSEEPSHQKDIAEAIHAPSVWVAEANGAIVGVLRGGRAYHSQFRGAWFAIPDDEKSFEQKVRVLFGKATRGRRG